MMDARDGILRQPDDPASKPWDPRFQIGELLSIKGCWFEVQILNPGVLGLRPVSDSEVARRKPAHVADMNRRQRRARARELRRERKR